MSPSGSTDHLDVACFASLRQIHGQVVQQLHKAWLGFDEHHEVQLGLCSRSTISTQLSPYAQRIGAIVRTDVKVHGAMRSCCLEEGCEG